MPNIEGETTYKAGDRTRRLEAAAAKASQHTEAMRRDAVRQRMFVIQDLRSKVYTAEQEVARLKREAADIEATIAEAREEMAVSGKRDPNLFRLTFEAAELPNMIAGADARLNTVRNELNAALDREAEHERQARARAAAEAELDRLAAERAAQLEALTAANLAADPVPAKRKGGK